VRRRRTQFAAALRPTGLYADTVSARHSRGRAAAMNAMLYRSAGGKTLRRFTRSTPPGAPAPCFEQEYRSLIARIRRRSRIVTDLPCRA